MLIINGHEYYDHSRGELNHTLFHFLCEYFNRRHNVKKTIIQNGYEKKIEQEKVKWADIVIYQTPIYCYSVPALFKKYFDEVHEYGVYLKVTKPSMGQVGCFMEESICFLRLGMLLLKRLGIARIFLKAEVLKIRYFPCILSINM